MSDTSASTAAPGGDGSTRSNNLPTAPLPPSLPTPAQLDALLRSPNSPIQHSRPSAERRDERCWITTKQTNARRALHRDSQTTMYCYMNFRHAIADLIPVPGLPGAYLARDVADVPSPSPPSSAPTPNADLPAYRWPALDGRYLYVATGNDAVQRHLEDMKKGVGVEEIAERCEKAKAEREAMGMDKYGRKIIRFGEPVVELKEEGDFDYPSYERIIPLSTLYSSSLQRLHTHVLRIYTPGLNNLARLPSTFTDGTQQRMLDTIYGKMTDGSAFRLAERLYTATVSVAGTLLERRRERESGSGSGGSGGLPPPPPPMGGLGGGPATPA